MTQALEELDNSTFAVCSHALPARHPAGALPLLWSSAGPTSLPSPHPFLVGNWCAQDPFSAALHTQHFASIVGLPAPPRNPLAWFANSAHSLFLQGVSSF